MFKIEIEYKNAKRKNDYFECIDYEIKVEAIIITDEKKKKRYIERCNLLWFSIYDVFDGAAEKEEFHIKKGDIVLVRDDKDDCWGLDVLASSEKWNMTKYNCKAEYWRYIAPYVGNEEHYDESSDIEGAF